MPSIVIIIISKAKSFHMISVSILVVISCWLIIHSVGKISESLVNKHENALYYSLNIELTDKYLGLQLFELLDSDIIKKYNLAKALVNNPRTEIIKYPRLLFGFFSYITGVFFMGTLISKINPWALIFTVIAAIVSIIISKRTQKYFFDSREKRRRINSKLNYITSKLTLDSKLFKELKFYPIGTLIDKYFSISIDEYKQYKKNMARIELLGCVISLSFIFVRDMISYFLLSEEIYFLHLQAEDILIYINSILSLSTMIITAINDGFSLYQGNLQINDFRAFLNYNSSHGGTTPVTPSDEKKPCIEFRNVSFSYDYKKTIIHNLSMKIYKGDKIAIVGENGAGKTTLLKLLTGLLIPQSGKIYIEGNDINHIDRMALYDYFTVVSQQATVLPETVYDNIVLADKDLDCSKIIHSLGIEKKINCLKYGEKTMLNSSINRDGVNLSGGEIQKILMARSIAHAHKVLLLDEPSSAMDSLSEEAIYQEYFDHFSDRTIIFITHRLQTVCFCDKIILLDNRGIAEMGSHQELLEKNGKYARMFREQKDYYTNATE